MLTSSVNGGGSAPSPVIATRCIYHTESTQITPTLRIGLFVMIEAHSHPNRKLDDTAVRHTDCLWDVRVISMRSSKMRSGTVRPEVKFFGTKKGVRNSPKCGLHNVATIMPRCRSFTQLVERAWESPVRLRSPGVWKMMTPRTPSRVAHKLLCHRQGPYPYFPTPKP